MENKRQKCFNKNHKEVNAISFCQICNVYMCNKCENFHSELCQNHILINLDKDNNDIFTGFCKEKDHFDKLKYFCKNHNQLCCAACITKIKGEGNGQHTDCDICFVEDIKLSKKNQLKVNIKYLEDLSKTFQQSIDKLKNIYENINNNKEELKLNIQKIFTKIRSEINDREDKLLNEVDNAYNNIYFDENLLKKSEKITKQINSNLENSKIIDNDWEDKNKSLSLIYDCINLENNIKYIIDINNNVTKYTSNNFSIQFNSDIESLINEIKTFGKIINQNSDNNFEEVLIKSKIIENKEQIKLLKDWLPYKKKEEIKCKLIYDAQRDGDSAATFHSLCDNKGATLTILTTSDNKKIGGFLSKSFGGNKGILADNNAFLFSLNYNEKYPSLNQGNNYYDNIECGPIYGYFCIYILDKCLTNNKNYYHPYTYRYNFGKRNKNEHFYFTAINLEIYQIITDEKI